MHIFLNLEPELELQEHDQRESPGPHCRREEASEFCHFPVSEATASRATFSPRAPCFGIVVERTSGCCAGKRSPSALRDSRPMPIWSNHARRRRSEQTSACPEANTLHDKFSTDGSCVEQTMSSNPPAPTISWRAMCPGCFLSTRTDSSDPYWHEEYCNCRRD